jgi:hypothetical protein
MVFHKCQAYKILRIIISEVYEFYNNLDPHVKLRMQQIKKVRDKAIELRENVDWVRDILGRHQGGQGESLPLPVQNPDAPLETIKEVSESLELSKVTGR